MLAVSFDQLSETCTQIREYLSGGLKYHVSQNILSPVDFTQWTFASFDTLLGLMLSVEKDVHFHFNVPRPW